MAATSKPGETKQATLTGHKTMVHYLKKPTTTEEHVNKQKLATSPVRKTPRRTGRPHKGKTTTSKGSARAAQDQTEPESETEDNFSDNEVFSEYDQGENNALTETAYNTLAELENDLIEEIDPRSVNINSETQPLVLLSLLRKIELLEQKQDQTSEENIELKKSIEFNANKIIDLESEVLKYKGALEATETKLDNVLMIVSRQKEQGSKLKEKSVKAESYSRRNNLRFEGIHQDPNESQNMCREKIYGILKNEFGIHDAERRIVIERCHRDKRYPNHNPPSILVRFLSFCDREEVWQQRECVNRNQRNRIFLNQDFPSEVERKRSFLRPYVKAAYSVGRKAVLVGDQIMVDGNKYSTTELENLPDNIHPDKVVIQEKNDVMLFYRSDAYLSNFHDSSMSIDNVVYQNVEQYFTAEKARTFNDQHTVSKIMESDNPSQMKFFGNNTKGFNQNIWNERASSVMIKGLRAKFQQNQKLRMKLLNTEDKHLAESSKNDKVWGTGLPMNDQNAFDKTNWQGKNQLGNLLMKVREEIRRNNN